MELEGLQEEMRGRRGWPVGHVFLGLPPPETTGLFCSKPPADSWDSRSKLMSGPTLS